MSRRGYAALAEMAVALPWGLVPHWAKISGSAFTTIIIIIIISSSSSSSNIIIVMVRIQSVSADFDWLHTGPKYLAPRLMDSFPTTLRPVRLLSVWVSEGLTQATS